jgi:hypothetical protein
MIERYSSAGTKNYDVRRGIYELCDWKWIWVGNKRIKSLGLIELKLRTTDF